MRQFINNNRAFLILGALIILIFMFVFLKTHGTKEDVRGSYAVSKIIHESRIMYDVIVQTEPHTAMVFRQKHIRSDANGTVRFLIPAANLPFELIKEPLFLAFEDETIIKALTIDNTTNLIRHESVDPWLTVNSNGELSFTLLLRIKPGAVATIDGVDYTPSSGERSALTFTFPMHRPNVPVIDTTLHVFARSQGDSAEGIIRLSIPFPNAKMVFDKNSEAGGNWQSPASLTFKGPRLLLQGTTVHDPSRGVYGQLTVNRVPVPLGQDGRFSVNLTTLKVGETMLRFVSEATGHVPSTFELQVTREMTTRERLADYQSKAEKISYPMLLKNADKFRSKLVVFSGKIFNIQEEDGQSWIQMHVTHKGYGVWDDQVIGSYSGETDFVRESRIWIFLALI